MAECQSSREKKEIFTTVSYYGINFATVILIPKPEKNYKPISLKQKYNGPLGSLGKLNKRKVYKKEKKRGYCILLLSFK